VEAALLQISIWHHLWPPIPCDGSIGIVIAGGGGLGGLQNMLCLSADDGKPDEALELPGW
jgi:hypothetical protein